MPAVAYLPEARDDIDQAYAGYERQRPGLGDGFLEALRRQLKLIEVNPALYGEVYNGARAAVLRRFPYVVYYREEPGHVLVLAVRHGRDDPSIWQGRT
jgi:plasmid stabilization system protein ParE